MRQGIIAKVAGPLIVAENMGDATMYDVVRVSEKRLIGEIIELRGGARLPSRSMRKRRVLGRASRWYPRASPAVRGTGTGLIESIFDGIQRPLAKIRGMAGDRIPRGVDVHALDREKKWYFSPAVQPGEMVRPGTVIGTVQETSVVLHKIMVPPGYEGEVAWIHSGEATIEEPIIKLFTSQGEVSLPMLQRWPVRRGRPYAEKLAPNEPMVTGQRVIDTLFPIARGGVAAVPGPGSAAAKPRYSTSWPSGRRGHHCVRGLWRARQ